MRGFWRTSVTEEVDAEVAFHLEMTTRELMERGMTRSQARAEAERRFGDVESVKKESRHFGAQRNRKVERAEYRDELRHDVGFAVRQLARSRGFSAVAIITLALGIGATAAVFSALDAVVLRPLPFDHPERIVEFQAARKGDPYAPSALELATMRTSNAFERVTGTVLQSGLTVMFGELPELIGGGRVTHEYFSVFGVAPMFGRTFTADEDVPGAPRVVVLSHRLWASRFNSDRGIVGRTLQINGVAHSVIGVMPASFDFTRTTEDLWVPLALSAEQYTKASEHFLRIFARLRPGVSIDQARAAALVAERAMAARVPERVDPVSDWGVSIEEFSGQLVGSYAERLLILLGAVGFVLLIACSNVANLLLARGAARAKELAIRAALGAGRGRLIRQLLTESLVLGLAGALLGLFVAFALLQGILAVSSENIPRLEQASISWRVLAFTLLVGVASCVLFGLLPALRAAGPRLQGALREGGRRTGGGSRDRVRGVLVATEVALAITLLVGSGLLIRSAWLMQRVDPGFDPRGVMTARLLLPEARYPTGSEIVRAYRAVRDGAAAIPGVASASVVSIVPMSGSQARSSILAEGQSRIAGGPEANLRLVSDNYFTTMGITLLAGRDVTRRDDSGAPLVVVVNQTLVKRLWPTLTPREAIGKRMDALSGGPSEQHLMEIVGVVADTHDEGLASPPSAAFYVPIAQTPEMLWPLLQRSLVLVARAANPTADPEILLKPLRQAIVQVDASLPLAEPRTMTSHLEGSLEGARMNTLLLSMLGGIALVLAMVGIYGVVAYFVSQRTHEIGVRMALGATPNLIWQYVVRRGLTPIVAGLVVGLGLSSLTTTLLRQQLYEVSKHDPATLGGVTALLLLVGLLATYVPARRAMRVPPVVALNEG